MFKVIESALFDAERGDAGRIVHRCDAREQAEQYVNDNEDHASLGGYCLFVEESEDV